ncbi:MAG: DUF1501 domain-containing protein [Planctomycetaceae bacterium]
MPSPRRTFSRSEQPAVEGLSRRRFLDVALLAGGCGLSLGDVLRLQAETSPSGGAKSDTAVIQLWLGGGPSQFETFDPKPEAPAEIRGPYSSIQSSLPGIQVCEKLPLTAQLMDRCSLIRSFTHNTDDHFIATHWCITGYPGVNMRPSHPSNGSLTSRFRGANRPGMPAYAHLKDSGRGTELEQTFETGHLGLQHSAFNVVQDWMQDRFQDDKLQLDTRNLKLADDLTLDRVEDRRSLLALLDRLPKKIDDNANTVSQLDQFNRAALDMIVSGEAKRAFDLTEEPDEIRDRYGRHRWGQMGLLARRLVEAGVSFVTVNLAPDSLCWDWHRTVIEHHGAPDDGTGRGMNVNGPPLDQLLYGLTHDLYERGLDKKVLVVVWGEFGRTPRINPTGGRDHWGQLMSLLLIGGGLQMGQVVGKSNRNGEAPLERPIGPTDVLAMIYRHLGIDPEDHTINAAGRPIPVLPNGRVISELI